MGCLIIFHVSHSAFSWFHQITGHRGWSEVWLGWDLRWQMSAANWKEHRHLGYGAHNPLWACRSPLPSNDKQLGSEPSLIPQYMWTQGVSNLCNLKPTFDLLKKNSNKWQKINKNNKLYDRNWTKKMSPHMNPNLVYAMVVFPHYAPWTCSQPVSPAQICTACGFFLHCFFKKNHLSALNIHLQLQSFIVHSEWCPFLCRLKCYPHLITAAILRHAWKGSFL